MSNKIDLPTIWEVSDDLWERIEPILEEAWPRRSGPGRRHIDWRKCLNGIIYHMRTGCQWNALPKQFGDEQALRNGAAIEGDKFAATACEVVGVPGHQLLADSCLAKDVHRHS